MAEITWKNVAAPNFSDALGGISAASKTLRSAGSGLRDVLSGIQETGESRYETEQTGIASQATDFANTVLDETGDHAQAQAAFKSKFSELGGSVERAGAAGTAYGTEREQVQSLKNRGLVKRASDEFMRVASETGDTKAAHAAADNMLGGNPELIAQVSGILNPVKGRMETLSSADQASLDQQAVNINAEKDLKLQSAQQVGNTLQAEITSLQDKSGINPETFKIATAHPGGVQKWAADLYEDSGMIDKQDSIVAIRNTRKKLVEDYGDAKADTLLFAAINNIALDRYGRLGDKGLTQRELEIAAVKLLPAADKIAEASNRYAKWQDAYAKDVINLDRIAANELSQTRQGFIKGGITGQGFKPGAVQIGKAGLASSAFTDNAFDKYLGGAPRTIENKPASKSAPKPKKAKKRNLRDTLRKAAEEVASDNFGALS